MLRLTRHSRSLCLHLGQLQLWLWIGRYTHLIGGELRYHDYRLICHLRKKGHDPDHRYRRS